MLHCDRLDNPRSLSLKQVEFNTIASSFGGLSNQVHELHRFLQFQLDRYWCSHSVFLDDSRFGDPTSLDRIVESLATAHRAYNKEHAVILFVVQDGERNVFDQRILEYRLYRE
jgi:hypothetical protein